MTRLIDADALINKYQSETTVDVFRYEVIEDLNNAPTVDAVPVRHGRWIPVDSYSAYGGDEVTWNVHGNPIAFHYCSECKNQAYANEFGEDILSSYCPNCGARMYEDKEE